MKPRACLYIAATAPSAPSPWRSRWPDEPRKRPVSSTSMFPAAGRRRIPHGGEYLTMSALPTCRAFCTRALSNRRAGSRQAQVDVAYGGNFYCIVDPQENFTDLADCQRRRSAALEPVAAQRDERALRFVSSGESLSTAATPSCGQACPQRTFYGTQCRILRRQAIDRSPCAPYFRPNGAIGTRAAAANRDAFLHESIIGSIFNGRVERR